MFKDAHVIYADEDLMKEVKRKKVYNYNIQRLGIFQNYVLFSVTNKSRHIENYRERSEQ